MSKNRSDRESSLPKPFAGSLLVPRRRLGALAAAALSCAAAAPVLGKPRAQPRAPRVYHAREATPGTFTAIFDRLLADLGRSGAPGRTGIKLHGDEVSFNRPLWEALQAHVPQSRYIECNWASVYTSGRGTTAGNIAAIAAQGVPRELIDVLDRDGAYRDVPVRGDADLGSVAVPEALFTDYDTLAVAANFKLESFAGYSGAMKNVGIGLAGAPGKTAVHGEGIARDAGFFRRLAAASEAICKALEGRLLFINVLTDLKPRPLKGAQPRGGTLGIVGSLSMAAADQAALSLIYGLSPQACDAFDENEKIARGFLQLENYARRTGLPRTFEMIEL